VGTGEVECATTQIVHWGSSPKLECWCAANTYADNSSSSRLSHAICFETDRIRAFSAR
jgi:hypothetical protein